MSLDEIHVVREYLDMFPDDLLGMPLDRAIKFKIELQPGTAHVYKWPYPMARNEMVELKTQRFSMGLPCYLCIEKGQDPAGVCRLSTTQCNNSEDQVSIGLH
jgi:hypothetical protein